MTDLKFASPVVTLAPSLAEMGAEKDAKTLIDVEAPALVNASSATLSDEVAKTIGTH